MTHNLEALTRALVASPWWRWMDGMVTRSGRRLSRSGERSIPPLGALPDLTDPATLGCLLALVREAWGRPAIVVVPGLSPDPAGHRWYIQDNPPNTASGYEPTLRTDGTFSALSASAEVSAPTEASALVAALLAAP